MKKLLITLSFLFCLFSLKSQTKQITTPNMSEGVVLSDTIIDQYGLVMYVVHLHFKTWFHKDWSRPINKRKPTYISDVNCYLEFPGKGYHIHQGGVTIYTYWNKLDSKYYHDLVFDNGKESLYTIKMSGENYVDFIIDNELVNEFDVDSNNFYLIK